jgi:SNF2 family DNA or RNA helicase
MNHESSWREPMRSLLLSRQWDVLIVDESHRAKAPGGKFSWFLKALMQRCERRLALTGTPMPHSPLDLYAQARFLSPGVFGTSFTRFRARYAIMGGYERRQVVGWQNMDEFWRKFRLLAYVAKKSDVLDLPEEVDMVRACTLEPKAQRLHDTLAAQLYAEIEAGEITAANALVKLLRMQQITAGAVKLDTGESEVVSLAKRRALVDLLEDLPAREPVVVFSRFHQDLDAVEAVATERSLKYAELSGRRKDALDDHARMHGDVELCGVQIQSGGLGVDLTRACYSVFWSTGFSLGDYLQARARIHRPGQERPVTHVHLIAEKTIDEKVMTALEARQEVVESIVGRRC